MAVEILGFVGKVRRATIGEDSHWLADVVIADTEDGETSVSSTVVGSGPRAPTDIGLVDSDGAIQYLEHLDDQDAVQAALVIAAQGADTMTNYLKERRKNAFKRKMTNQQLKKAMKKYKHKHNKAGYWGFYVEKAANPKVVHRNGKKIKLPYKAIILNKKPNSEGHPVTHTQYLQRQGEQVHRKVGNRSVRLNHLTHQKFKKLCDVMSEAHHHASGAEEPAKGGAKTASVQQGNGRRRPSALNEATI